MDNMKEIIVLLNNNSAIKFKGSDNLHELLKLLNDQKIIVVQIGVKNIPKHRITAVFISNVNESEANLNIDIQNRVFPIFVNDFAKTSQKLKEDINTGTGEFVMVENELIFAKYAFNASEEGPAYQNIANEDAPSTVSETLEKEGVLNGNESEPKKA